MWKICFHCHTYVLCFGSPVSRKLILRPALDLSRFARGLLKSRSREKKKSALQPRSGTIFI